MSTNTTDPIDKAAERARAMARHPSAFRRAGTGLANAGGVTGTDAPVGSQSGTRRRPTVDDGGAAA